MKFDPSKNYSAPACARGIWVLNCLAINKVAMSLEQLFQVTGIPKATLSRILETLMEVDLVKRLDNRTYEALVGFEKTSIGETSFEDLLELEMVKLSKECRFTVEWYEFADEGMIIRRSICPLTESLVKAREGFVREWQGEVDSVYRVGYAFAEKKLPENEIPWSFDDKGNKKALSWSLFLKECEAIKTRGHSVDIHFNRGGVRRAAIAVSFQGEYKGVLAVAECWRPSTNMQVNEELDRLLQLQQHISSL